MGCACAQERCLKAMIQVELPSEWGWVGGPLGSCARALLDEVCSSVQCRMPERQHTIHLWLHTP